MGRVWAARERNTTLKPRLVAIKTALSEDGATEGFWKVLFDEGRIASQVTHPNVCSIHAVERERGIVYLVMDWSDGGSLRELLDALPNHRLDFPMAARIVSRVCSGLHAVHELVGEDGEPLGVVHRDVSPQNVLISTKGQVRLTDFGVAKARGQVHAPTQTGEVKGKIAYMAPEQVTTKDIDRRADVFALGCVLYEATTGQRPFSGADALATLYALLEQPLVPPSEKMPGYPPELEAVVLKALERNAADRYQTTEELGRALEVWLVTEKLSVADSNVATMLNTTLGDRIKARTKEIDDAIAHIENPRTKDFLLASELTPEPATTVATLGGSATPMPTSTPVPSTKGRGVLFGLVGLAAVAAGVFFFTRGPAAVEKPVADSAHPVPSPVASVEPANPEPTTIDISIGAEPANATLTLDGAPVNNPFSAAVMRDSRPHTVLAKADGFVEKEEVVVFDSARNVTIKLEAAPAGAKKGVAIRRPVTPSHAAATPAAPAEPARPSQQDPGMPVVRKPIRTLDSDNPFAPKP
jgi:serine/threonine-protein kinase